jgi:hypothetical protein
MKNDLFLPSGDGSKAVKNILSGIGIFCGVTTVLVFSTLFFADVSLCLSSAVDISVDFALLFFSSYVMYFSLFDTGAEKGKALPETVAWKEKRERLFSRYRKDGSGESLSAFCAALSKEKTREQRELLLSRLSLTEKEVEALAAKEKPSLKERSLLWRIKRAPRIRITPKMLLSERMAEADVPFSHTPEKMRRRRFFRFLLPTVLTALLSVSLAAEVILNPTANEVVSYLFKLFTLLFNGVKGFRSGYSYIASDKNAYMREQCFWLEEYFAALEKAC